MFFASHVKQIERIVRGLSIMFFASHVKQIDGRQWRHKPKLLKNNFTCY